MKSYRRRITLPSLGIVSVNFYCISSVVVELYEMTNEFERQKSINHLGLISHEVDGASHSRYEYLMLQCALSDLLDKLHKGSLAQGSLKVDGKTFRGNAILKSWFLLSNFGHLKNTLGDEKTLIQYALDRPGFRTRLLQPIRSAVLKSWCEDVIRNFDYYRFHYVLAIYRLYKEQGRLLDKQDQLAMLMELLLIDLDKSSLNINRSKLMQLRGLFRKIRDIAIVAIDGHYSHIPLSINLMSSIVSFDEIEGGVFGKDISSSLSPLRHLLHEEIYLNPHVLANQRSYEVNALKKITQMPSNSDSYDRIISCSFSEGLLTAHQRDLIPFYRIAIPTDAQPDTSFLEEFNRLTSRVQEDCQNVEAYLDVNPYTNIRYADFFISSQFSERDLPRFLFNILTLIKDQIDHSYEKIEQDFQQLLSDVKNIAVSKGLNEASIEQIINELNSTMVNYRVQESAGKQLFPLFRSLLWSVINYFIKDQYRIEVEQSESPYENYSFSYGHKGDNFLRDAVGEAVKYEQDLNPDRAHELKMLERIAKSKFNKFRIACLARVKVLDMTKSPEEMTTTDIDAVLLTVSENSLKLEILEAKNTKKQRELAAKKDLRDKLVPVLNRKGSYRILEVKGFGAKLVLSCEKT